MKWESFLDSLFLIMERIEKMKNIELKQMEELDAKIEKVNYDLLGLESRKQEMENNKFEKQQNIENLEDEKKKILAKTDKMNRLEKIIYIAFASKMI